MTKKKNKTKKSKRPQKPQKHGQRTENGGLGVLMRRAVGWPIAGCTISPSWREGLATIHLLRQSGNRIATLLVDVDLGCLGVKSCFFHPDLERDTWGGFESILAEEEAEGTMVDCEPSLAAKIIREAVRYAAELGFEPHPELARAQALLEGIDPDECPEEIPLGRDGKPCYYAEEGDDKAAILEQLESRCGKDGFLVRYRTEDPEPFELPAGVREALPAGVADRWTELRKTRNALVARGLNYVFRTFDSGFLRDAALDCSAIMNTELVDDPLDDEGFRMFVLPWAIFRGCDGDPQEPVGDLLGDEEAEERGGPEPLTEIEREVLKELHRFRTGFYRVISCDSEQGSLRLKDCLLDREVEVYDLAASSTTTRGIILLASVLSYGGISILSAVAYKSLPGGVEEEIELAREQWAKEHGALDDERLRDLDAEIRALYADIVKDLYYDAYSCPFRHGWIADDLGREEESEQDYWMDPQTENADGELIAAERLTYRLDLPAIEALDALISLAPSLEQEDIDTFRKEVDQTGRVAFEWEREGEDPEDHFTEPYLGRLELDAPKLIALVSSKERADRIQSELRERLGDRVELLSREDIEVDEYVSAFDLEPDDELLSENLDNLHDLILAGLASWVDTPMEAFGGKTPRDEARTQKGRERVKVRMWEVIESAPPELRLGFELMLKMVTMELHLDDD